MHHLLLVTKGGGSHVIDVVRHPLSVGAVVSVTAGQVHQFGHEPDLDARMGVFRPEALSHAMSLEPCLLLPPERWSLALALVEGLAGACATADGEERSRQWVEALLQALVRTVDVGPGRPESVGLLRRFHDASSPTAGTRSGCVGRPSRSPGRGLALAQWRPAPTRVSDRRRRRNHPGHRASAPSNDSRGDLDMPHVGWRFDHSYARLPAAFFAPAAPTPVAAPRVVVLNRALGASLGLDLDAMSEAEAAVVFAGNTLPEGAAPLAQAYAGHQFGHFTMLGDGRAILLGEHLTPDGRRVDVQLKGPGRTPFSRRGDGRAALGPMLREHIISEAMHTLGIPTTRSLAVVTTGERVMREEPLAGAVLTRIAGSHIRVGTVEYAGATREVDHLRALVEYTLARHGDAGPDAPPAARLLRRSIEQQAALVARWMHVGFIHGVMNTDNMSLAGETIDYGPCAFMDTYDPATVFSSIDHGGRYAFGNQPRIAHWNLIRLAEALLPVLGATEGEAVARAEAELGRFPALFQTAWLEGMRRKLGLPDAEPEDEALVADLLDVMNTQGADYTNTFRALADAEPPALDAAWTARWQARRARSGLSDADARALMRAHSPDVIPRNHQVERALVAAGWGDLEPLHTLLAALARPYDDAPEHAAYRAPPTPEERVRATFCGT